MFDPVICALIVNHASTCQEQHQVALTKLPVNTTFDSATPAVEGRPNVGDGALDTSHSRVPFKKEREYISMWFESMDFW